MACIVWLRMTKFGVVKYVMEGNTRLPQRHQNVRDHLHTPVRFDILQPSLVWKRVRERGMFLAVNAFCTSLFRAFRCNFFIYLTVLIWCQCTVTSLCGLHHGHRLHRGSSELCCGTHRGTGANVTFCSTTFQGPILVFGVKVQLSH